MLKSSWGHTISIYISFGGVRFLFWNCQDPTTVHFQRKSYKKYTFSS